MGIWDLARQELGNHSWLQVRELFLAFVLSSLIGAEREFRLKAAGLRTHALVGLGAALMMLVSKYGFSDILPREHISLDPSRVAAQIVSGIGFIGGGLIFVRRDIVHGLTTAATIWLTAGVGMACGGGLPILAVLATLGHFMIAVGYTRIMHRVMGVTNRLTVRYKQAGTDVAGKVLALCSEHDFTIRGFTMKTDYADPATANLQIRVMGSKPVTQLSEKINRIDGVVSINVNASNEEE